MSLAEIQQIVTDIYNVTNTSVLPTLQNVDSNITAITGDALVTMKQAQHIMTRLDPVIDSIQHIEDFIFALLIVISVMLLGMFLFWFFRHVYPLITKQHTHEHTANNVVKDLTDTPIRVQSVNGFEKSLKRDFD